MQKVLQAAEQTELCMRWLSAFGQSRRTESVEGQATWRQTKKKIISLQSGNGKERLLRCWWEEQQKRRWWPSSNGKKLETLELSNEPSASTCITSPFFEIRILMFPIGLFCGLNVIYFEVMYNYLKKKRQNRDKLKNVRTAEWLMVATWVAIAVANGFD